MHHELQAPDHGLSSSDPGQVTLLQAPVAEETTTISFYVQANLASPHRRLSLKLKFRA